MDAEQIKFPVGAKVRIKNSDRLRTFGMVGTVTAIDNGLRAIRLDDKLIPWYWIEELEDITCLF